MDEHNNRSILKDPYIYVCVYAMTLQLLPLVVLVLSIELAILLNYHHIFGDMHNVCIRVKRIACSACNHQNFILFSLVLHAFATATHSDPFTQKVLIKLWNRKKEEEEWMSHCENCVAFYCWYFVPLRCSGCIRSIWKI